jgi:hypothetical protein
VQGFIERFGLTSEDVKNLSVSAALAQMVNLADDPKTKGLLTGLIGQAKRMGLGDSTLSAVSSASRDGNSVRLGAS